MNQAPSGIASAGLWRKVKRDWGTENDRALAEEPIVRRILDGHGGTRATGKDGDPCPGGRKPQWCFALKGFGANSTTSVPFDIGDWWTALTPASGTPSPLAISTIPRIASRP